MASGPGARPPVAGDAATSGYTTRALTPGTWDDFAALVEANRGVWGGCWCLGFHAAAPTGSYEGNRDLKRSLVEDGAVRQVLVYDGDTCVGWCQYGTPDEVPSIKNPKAYAAELDVLPTWRIGCIFTGSRHRGRGVARAAVTAVLGEVAAAGGGLLEAYPEQVADREPQRGAYLHTGPETLYADLGFVRHRRIAKWRWVMRRRVEAST